MKKLTKRINLLALSMLCAGCCLCAGTVGLNTTAQAASALETEFTHNGQFAVSYYTGNSVYAYEFVDGAAEGLPAGYTGAVAKIASKATGGAPYINIDFSASKIKASMVKSVVVRVYSPDYTTADELRINNAANSVGGAGAHDLSTWCEVELPLNLITGADGNLGSFAFGLRDKGTISNYFYIDSITVNMVETVDVTFTGVHSWWNNYVHNDTYCSIIEFSGGIAKGNLQADYSDIYAKATLNSQPIDTTNFSLICRAWIDGGTDSLVMRWVTLPEAGSILHIPAGTTFTNGSEDANLYEIAEDIYMQFNGTTWAKIDNPSLVEKATFNSLWSNMDAYNATDRILLIFNSTTAWNHTDKGTLASKVTYKNSETGATYSPTNNDIAGWDGQRWIIFTGTTDYDMIQIMGGGQFGGVEIPAITLYKVNGRWVTTPASEVTTNYFAIAAGWNNLITNGLAQTIVSFDLKPLAAVADPTNLAATMNRTSLMVKYNGKTFRELYADTTNANAQQYRISYAHGNNHFYFAIPEADLVEGATFEIEEGTPFAGQGLGAVTLVYKNGAWEYYKEANYNPDFTSIGELNHAYNEALGAYGLSLRYDTSGFTADGTQVSTKQQSGFTLNGENVGVALWGGNQLLFWLHKERCEAGYNGYEYATLKIEEGAKIVNAEGKEYTFKALTLYLVDGQWTTEKPAVTEKATFNSIWGNADTYNDSDSVLLIFNSTTAWNHTDKGTLASKITYRNSSTGDAYTATDSDITGWDGQKWIILTGMTGYDTIEIAAGGKFGGVEIPALTIYNVNGRWVTTPASAVTTNYFAIATGWNNLITNGLAQTIVSFDLKPLAAAADSTNLAATTNRTSMMVKYNGKTFRDLYTDTTNANAQKYAISYAHGNNHFYFAIPEADLVEGAMFEIEEGTPFAGQGLGAVKLIFKNGAWEYYEETNYNPNFVSIGRANHVANGNHYGVSLKYNTNGFTDENEQIIAASYMGITINSDAQTTALWGGDQLLFWISADKLVEGYNGYSHPTLKIMEGATVTNKYGETFTLGAATLYLVDGQWTTEKPAGYSVTVNIPDLGEPDCVFKGFSHWNNNNGMTLLEFTNFVNQPTVGQSYLSSTGHYVTLNGTKLTEVPGANIYTWEGTNWLRIDIMNPTEGSVLIIEEGTPFAGNYLPKLVFQFHDGVWAQAFIVNMEINGETFTVYSKNDVPVILSDTYFADLLAENDIPGKVVSFSTRGVTYPAGTVFKALTDTDITVEVIGFATTEGASVRLNTPTGIRYETKIDKADYDRLVALYGEANVETGTYIVPKSMLGSTDFRNYFADLANVDGTDYVRIINSGFANKETIETDGYYLYYGSLVKLQSNNYATNFFGIGYIQITDGDNVYTVFGGYDTEDYTRTIYYVASHAYNDYANGSAEQAVLKSYMDSVLYIEDDMAITNIVNPNGYVSPYSVNYDAQTGVYTITGNAEIKSVIIGGQKRTSSRMSTLKMNGQEYYVTDYNLTASENYSTLTFKLSPVMTASALVDFTVEVPSYRGMKILQITDTELMDAAQMRTANSLTAAQQEEYARKNIYANCFNYISTLVAQDRPDLIILTGDIVNGAFDDNGSMWLRLIEFMDSLNIPWAPVFGGLENASAQGAEWQREQLMASENCLFKAGSVTGNGDYTIAITDNGVIRRVIYMLNGNAGAGINQTQVDWMKSVSANIAQYYVDVPAFVCFNSAASDFASDFAAANVDGVFMGNAPSNNSTALNNGIYYTYGTKTGSYGDYNASKLGGTYIDLTCDGLDFIVTAECLDKTEMQEMKSIDLVTTYDGSSVVTDAYLTPIWDTDRVYDETGLFVGETGSVTLMYTPSNPEEVVVRDITLGVTYTYGIDYTISGNKVTRVAGGNLPYRPYDEYYLDEPVYVNGVPQGWKVTTKNGKTEDGYTINGTKYMYYDEAYIGASRHVMFSYDKAEAWTGTKITGDTKAQSFIDKLKTEKEGTIMFYGDSITVGCNASGTAYGDYRNPYLPAWNDLVTNSLSEMYGAKINKYNGAVGGWTTAQGAENFTSKVAEVGTTLADIDLLVIAFGMNDPVTSQSSYTASIKQMINTYYEANPNGSVLLVSPMLPNTQSSMICGNQTSCESWLNNVKNSSEYAGKNISLAKVFTMFNELVTVSGKLSRDYLGNNVNHPNDFGVRIYAQVILKTLCGDDFA